MTRWLRQAAVAFGASALALLTALSLGALLMLAAPAISRWGAGEPLPPIDPLQVYRVMLDGAIGTRTGVSWVLYHATILTLTGLAVALPFKAGRFNIGGEGQMRVAGLAAAATSLGLAGTLSGAGVAAPWLHAALALAAAALAGALWGAIPGALAAYRGAHEVITTIMLNFVAIALTQYLVVHHLLDRSSGVVQTAALPEAALWPRLAALGLPADPRVPLTLALPLALLTALGCAYALTRLRWGYEVRAVGQNPDAAAAAGIDAGLVTVGSMALAGAIAGLASLALIHGNRGHFGDHVFIAGYGFLGIAVALLARNHPLAVVPAALLFGVLFQGTAEVEVATDVPKALIQILQGLVILAVVVTGELGRPRGART